MTSNCASYRPALDGVRAIAVLGVIAYHFGFTWLPGGFLGVDVFFVFSGYLITTLLIREHDNTGRINLAEFWARRARRLLPALLLLVLAVSAWVYWVAPFETWMARRRDIVWTLFYGANWHFIQTGQDYFAQYAGASPLLHAWSLAIEEQFYFFWPLLFLALYTLRSRRRLMIAVCAAAAAVSAARMATLYGSAGLSRAYYGTDGRLQALLVGASLALLMLQTKRPVRRRRELTWSSTILMVVTGGHFLLLHDNASFYYRGGALAFALVVAALIWTLETAPSSWLGRVLSLPPLPWIGRISYGLYLWHWFVLVVTLNSTSTDFARSDSVLARLLLTIGAATASFYLVERPIREGRVPWLRRSPARLALVAPLALALAAFVAVRATTVPTSLARGQHLDVELAVALADHSDKECPKPENVTFSWCIRHQGSGDRPVIATIGDSIARALGPGLDAESAKSDFTFIQAAWGGCTISGIPIPQINLLGITSYDVACHDEAISTVESMIESVHPDVLLMTEHTAVFSRLRVDDRWVPLLSDQHDRVLADGYAAVFGRFLERVDHIVLIETNQDGLRVGCTPRPANRSTCSSPPSAVEAVERFNSVLRTVAEQFPGRVSVVSVADLVCPSGTCVAIRDGMLIRYDGQHYTATFSRWLMPQLLDRVDAATGILI